MVLNPLHQLQRAVEQRRVDRDIDRIAHMPAPAVPVVGVAAGGGGGKAARRIALSSDMIRRFIRQTTVRCSK